MHIQIKQNTNLIIISNAQIWSISLSSQMHKFEPKCLIQTTPQNATYSNFLKNKTAIQLKDRKKPKLTSLAQAQIPHFGFPF